MQLKRWIALGTMVATLAVAGCGGQGAQAPKATPGQQAPAQPTQPAQTAAGGNPIKIGFVVSFTGAYAALAEDQWRGAQLAAEEINAKGGLAGRPITFIPRDDKLNPGESAKVTQELIQNEKVDMIVGGMNAAANLAINEQAKKANVPVFIISQSNQINKKPDWGPYSFHEALTPHMNGQATGRWVVENLGKKVYFLMPDYAFGKENYESFSAVVKAAGGTEVGADWFPLGNNDFTTYVNKIRAKKPDVLVSAALGADQVNLVKQLVSFGLNKEMKIFFAVVDLQADIAAGFQNIAGMYGGSNFYWELADKIPEAKKFVEAYQKKWNVPPSGYSGYGYSALWAIKLAADKAGSVDKDKLVQALEGLEYASYKGKQFYRKCDHQAIQPIYIVKGRTADEAKNAGKEKYGLREVIAEIPADEKYERTCDQLGLGDRK